MYFDRGSPYLDAEREASQGNPLDSCVRGNDHPLVRMVCLHARAHNTL
jgi:hypothetical protein